jgi:hypothetical protein
VTAFVVSGVLIALLSGANAGVTYAVGHSAFYDERQKRVQIALVWLLPVFGLVLVGGVFWSNYERPSSRGGSARLEIPDYAWTEDLPGADHH